MQLSERKLIDQSWRLADFSGAFQAATVWFDAAIRIVTTKIPCNEASGLIDKMDRICGQDDWHSSVTTTVISKAIRSGVRKQ